MIKIIVAMDKNNLIGNQTGETGMPWYNSEDLQHFKETTLNQTIVMGRVTYQAIGKPLPQRKTIVVSKQNLFDENISVAHDLMKVINEYKNKQEDLYICGGASIYEQSMDNADELIVSYIVGEYQGDAYFPSIDEKQFDCVEVIQKETFILKRYRRKN